MSNDPERIAQSRPLDHRTGHWPRRRPPGHCLPANAALTIDLPAMPSAFITGITGQDGSYLAELLLAKGYRVHGLLRPGTDPARSNLRHLLATTAGRDPDFVLHPADLADNTALQIALEASQPDEIYHLAAQSHSGLSFEQPESAAELTAMATIRLLEAARGLTRPPRVFYASSSEVFGQPAAAPQDEDTPFNPVTPYGCAKAFATQMARVYRRSYGLFVANGINYNHESPRRGENFVSRKICRGAAAIKLGLQKELLLGDLNARRDWGYAPDFVRGMWLALQAGQPEDYVFATGTARSVEQLAEAAFRSVGLHWRDHVRQDAGLLRPAEPGHLVGNAARAQRLLGWKPTKPFEEMIAEMTAAELAALGS